VCHSYSDLNFGVTFWNTVYKSCASNIRWKMARLTLEVCNELKHSIKEINNEANMCIAKQLYISHFILLMADTQIR